MNKFLTNISNCNNWYIRLSFVKIIYFTFFESSCTHTLAVRHRWECTAGKKTFVSYMIFTELLNWMTHNLAEGFHIDQSVRAISDAIMATWMQSANDQFKSNAGANVANSRLISGHDCKQWFRRWMESFAEFCREPVDENAAHNLMKRPTNQRDCRLHIGRNSH